MQKDDQNKVGLSSKESLISTWKKEMRQIAPKDHYQKHFREVWISQIHQG